jgi:hypothetical protein
MWYILSCLVAREILYLVVLALLLSECATYSSIELPKYDKSFLYFSYCRSYLINPGLGSQRGAAALNTSKLHLRLIPFELIMYARTIAADLDLPALII